MATIVIDVNTTGGDGAATGTADSPPLFGKLREIEVAYLNSAPNTTTVDIDELLAANATGRKVLDKAASNTNTTHYPNVASQDNTGAGVTFDGTNEIYQPFVFSGRKVRVTLDDSDELSPAVRVTLKLED